MMQQVQQDVWWAHICICVYMGISKQGWQNTLWVPSGFSGDDDSHSGVYGICGDLCASACRHVLSEEVAMTQWHAASVGTCVDMCLSAGMSIGACSPGGGGSGCDSAAHGDWEPTGQL